MDVADIPDGRTFVGRAIDAGRAFYKEFVNRHAPLERLAKVVGGDTGKLLKELVITSRGVAESARSVINRGTRLFDEATGSYRYTGRGLRQILAGSDQETVRDLSRWMASERELELGERQSRYEAEYEQARAAREDVQRQIRNAERRGDFEAAKQLRRELPPKPSRAHFLEVDSDAVRDASDTLTVLESKWGDRHPELLALAGEVRAWSRKAILEPLREVGYLSQEAFDSILAENEFYTPYFRVIESLDSELQIVASTSRPLKRISGDISKQIANPLESMVLKAQQVQI